VKEQGQKLGLTPGQAEDPRHAFVKEVVPALEQSEPARVHQECEVFFSGGKTGKFDRDGESAFGWPSCHD
jgi:hypothetical protein